LQLFTTVNDYQHSRSYCTVNRHTQANQLSAQDVGVVSNGGTRRFESRRLATISAETRQEPEISRNGPVASHEAETTVEPETSSNGTVASHEAETRQEPETSSNGTVASHEAETRQEPETSSYSSVATIFSHVKLPSGMKCRGRPKRTDKSLNVRYGEKGGQRTKQPSRKRQAVAAVCDPDEENSSNCVEYGLSEPPLNQPKRRCKARTEDTDVQWVQCDDCNYWYHLRCTSLVVVPGDGEPFSCVRCG